MRIPLLVSLLLLLVSYPIQGEELEHKGIRFFGPEVIEEPITGVWTILLSNQDPVTLITTVVSRNNKSVMFSYKAEQVLKSGLVLRGLATGKTLDELLLFVVNVSNGAIVKQKKGCEITYEVLEVSPSGPAGRRRHVVLVRCADE